MKGQKEHNTPGEFVLLFLYLSFFAGLIFSFRAVSSIACGLLLVTGMFLHSGRWKSLFSFSPITAFIWATLFYVIMVKLNWLFTGTNEAGWKDLQLKSGLFLVPLAIFFSYPKNNLRLSEFLLKGYCLLLVAASIYCLAKNISLYMPSGNYQLFFYHQLVAPIRQHAVYFSIYCLAGMIILLTGGRDRFLFTKPVTLILTFFFSLFLLLLSSKLVIVFLFLFLFLFFRRRKNNQFSGFKYFKAGLLTVLLISLVLLVTNNPISHRFRLELRDPALAEQEHYDPGTYFNGVQFRLLQFRLIPRILNEQHKWIAGVGPGRSQLLLNDQYYRLNMYTGKNDEDPGYRAYNAHNQFLESLLRYGLVGLLLFILVCIALVSIIAHIASPYWKLFLVLILLYSLVESVLETQYGIFIFTCFPAFLFLLEGEPTRKTIQTI